MKQALALALLAVGGCMEAPVPEPAPSDPALAEPAPGLEAPATPPASSADPTSSQAAADVVLTYYGAVAEQDYARAYEMWGPDGPPDQSLEVFESGFDETAEVRATVDAPGDPEGAAGSVYVTVPVNVSARTAAGAEQRFEGEYTLRRVNDVPGAEPWQLRWHIASADLREIQ